MSDVKDTCCVLCCRDPFVWDTDKNTATNLFNARYLDFKVEGSLVEHKQAQSVRCLYMYQACTRDIYGVLGKGLRIHHPQCVVEVIPNLAPEPTDNYTGHVDIIHD